ncbi:hypothetical protein BDW69DRAFT_157378 [Aspergillus filifer]
MRMPEPWLQRSQLRLFVHSKSTALLVSLIGYLRLSNSCVADNRQSSATQNPSTHRCSNSVHSLVRRSIWK